MALRDTLGRWLFEQDPRENWPGAQKSDAEWENWVERNQEEWKDAADDVLTFSPVSEIYKLAKWLVSLDDDDPESQGRQDRKTVTLDQIINKARLALDADAGPYTPYEDDGEQD